MGYVTSPTALIVRLQREALLAHAVEAAEGVVAEVVARLVERALVNVILALLAAEPRRAGAALRTRTHASVKARLPAPG